MRALVTGAGGFVGRHLVCHLAECGDEVLGVDLQNPRNLVEGLSPELQKSVSSITLDISDFEKCSRVISEFKPDIIYHLAGIAFVPEAENNFDRALLVNVGGTNNIIRTCHLLQLGTTIVYISSAEVYGKISQEDLPLSEELQLKPANNYSLSKLMGELVAERYDRFGYVRTVIARPFNHIGPYQNDRFVVSSFAHQLARIAKGKSEPVIRVGNLEARRDFSDVRDIVRAYRLMALKGTGVYNLCSGSPHSIQFVLDTLLEISGLKVEILTDPARMRPAEVPELFGSYARAEKELGWKPEYDIKKTLNDVYDYWLSE